MKLGLIFPVASLVFYAASVNAIARADDPVHTVATFRAPAPRVARNIPARTGQVQRCDVVRGNLICNTPAVPLNIRADRAAK